MTVGTTAKDDVHLVSYYARFDYLLTVMQSWKESGPGCYKESGEREDRE